MGYLVPADYKKTIQADNLAQVISGDPTILEDAELVAIEDARSQLVQKYIVDREFQDTPKWDVTETYQAFERVYLDATLFSAAIVYTIGQYITYQPDPAVRLWHVYKSISGSAAHAFVANEWTQISTQYAIYQVKTPAPEFNYQKKYVVGDQVVWANKVYTCKVASTTMTQELAIQYFNYESVPFGNVFPDNVVNGPIYWGNGVAFSLAPGADITDTTKWVKGDNRCKQVVWAVAAITLYYIHARIAPRNVPDLRVNDYNRALDTLEAFALGKKTPTLPMIQPRTGHRIRYGGQVKNQNSY